MADYNEEPFEREICEYLAAHGWLYSPDDRGYDRERALFPEDIIGWLAETQPDELGKVLESGSAKESQQRDQLLDRLVKTLDTPMEAGGGTLNVLRRGFKHVSAKFEMCQFKPETGMNAADIERYDRVRVRVMRQVHFSTADQRSIDLVMFVNGLPVAMIELKTDFTQSVSEAINQYKKDRRPKDKGTGHAQPLLGFGNRALVHFAVSNDEVWMSTRLAGDKTRFLPFNRGRDSGAGNPLNPDGSASSYLWEQVLQRDSLLDILGKFMHAETREQRDPISGKVSKSTTLIFPRYHQWDAVRKLTEAAWKEGPGHRYLIQHSAGSGKTNSIAWVAHRLARLHDAEDKKVFDSVIVVTDRNVLDAQLQEAIRQIDGGLGIVTAIDKDGVATSGAGSKSGLLAKALSDGKLIIVVTIQTFPFALQEIRESKGLKGRRFAVIADEAHSSQTGATANKLKEVLSAEELKAVEDGGEIDTEAILAAEMTNRASNENISYFAFTATPKAKTLELFGRKVDGGLPEPFHIHTMKQAIEERFILDVLRGYQTYDTAFQIAQNAEREKIVDEAAATRGLMRWVKLHPTNIGQKVQIIVEHFRENVAGMLEGHAKAMVVTDSRKAAVRFKIAIDKYIEKQGYEGLGTLVAFSGSVDDPESGPEPFTEGAMNPGLGGQSLRAAFNGNDFRIMLVANKFQTGFDQPLLCAMYVDKRLSGVTAVQTLSRLNRTYTSPSGELKSSTMVLDFVNDPEEIKDSFEPYFADVHLDTETDPNLVHDIAAKLDQAGIYTDDEVEALVKAWLAKAGNSALAAAIDPPKKRFRDRYNAAIEAEDKAELDLLEMFRKDVGTFVRLYEFMSQIIDYGDTDLEKKSIFLRLLERQIRPDSYSAEVDLSDVELRNIKQIDRGRAEIELSGGEGLSGVTEAGSSTRKDPKMVAFQEIVDRLNELFGDEDFTKEQKESFLEGLLSTLLSDPTLVTQAKANKESQFLESPDLADAIIDAVEGNQSSHNRIAEYFFAETAGRDDLIERIGALVHMHASEKG
jgi:type I restriction enzyme R subunit